MRSGEANNSQDLKRLGKGGGGCQGHKRENRVTCESLSEPPNSIDCWAGYTSS